MFWKTIKKNRMPYLFISPFFILFLIFQLIPVIWTFVISFSEWNGFGAPLWCGFDNFRLMAEDYMVKDALTNNIVYWFSSLIIIFIFSMLIALALKSENLRFKRFYKTATFLPYVCASVAMGLIFGMLFDENAGLINEILVSLGSKRIPWLNSSRWSKIPVIALFNWRTIPWFTMIIFSGLLNIPNELYEAATVDGANNLQKFTRITLPSLSNILFFCSLTITANVWKMFNESYILSGPGSSNTSVFQLVYEYGFTIFKLGYASALSVLLIIVMLIISVMQFIVRKRQGEI